MQFSTPGGTQVPTSELTESFFTSRNVKLRTGLSKKHYTQRDKSTVTECVSEKLHIWVHLLFLCSHPFSAHRLWLYWFKWSHTILESYEDFQEAIDYAIQNSPGFRLPWSQTSDDARFKMFYSEAAKAAVINYFSNQIQVFYWLFQWSTK